MLQADQTIRLGKLAGVNQEPVGRLPQELADCQNIIGEPSGFSVWGGRTRFSAAGLGKNRAIRNITWPDEHRSLVVVGEQGVHAIESGIIHHLDYKNDSLADEIGGDLRNPVHFTQHSYGRYLIGSFYGRQSAFYWDGHIDRDLGKIETPDDMEFRVIESWAGRLWGIGSEDFPLQVFFGAIDALKIDAANWLSFYDNPLTSRIVGMRAANRNYAYVWGDRGVFQVEFTGSYPLFVNPQLLHADCDCISNSSIVQIPGMGFAWMGREGVWMMSGDNIRRIDISYDTTMQAYARKEYDIRQSYRLKGEFSKIPIASTHLCSGFWYGKRGLAVWSYPTEACIEQHEWQSPRSIAWRHSDNTWWLLDQGWQSVAEVVHQGKRLPVGTDQDGYIYLLDHNIAYDKISVPVEWSAEFHWQGDPSVKMKFLQAILERPFSGAERVEMEAWTKYQSTPHKYFFSLDEAYDDASRKRVTYLTVDAAKGDRVLQVQDTVGWPETGFVRVADNENREYETLTATTITLKSSAGLGDAYLADSIVEIKDFDPGGPNDVGLPPDPMVQCKKMIRLVGNAIKVRLSNKHDNGFWNGPRCPLNSLTILAKTLGSL